MKAAPTAAERAALSQLARDPYAPQDPRVIAELVARGLLRIACVEVTDAGRSALATSEERKSR